MPSLLTWLRRMRAAGVRNVWGSVANCARDAKVLIMGGLPGQEWEEEEVQDEDASAD